jgi:hypothetical protein
MTKVTPTREQALNLTDDPGASSQTEPMTRRQVLDVTR